MRLPSSRFPSTTSSKVFLNSFINKHSFSTITIAGSFRQQRRRPHRNWAKLAFKLLVPRPQPISCQCLIFLWLLWCLLASLLCTPKCGENDKTWITSSQLTCKSTTAVVSVLLVTVITGWIDALHSVALTLTSLRVLSCLVGRVALFSGNSCDRVAGEVDAGIKVATGSGLGG